MTQHDDSVRIRHMLDHAREAVAMVKGRTREDLDRDRMLELAPVRLIEIVGEAAARVSEEGKAAHPTVPWREVVGMRNRLVHGYDTVDCDVLYGMCSMVINGHVHGPVMEITTSQLHMRHFQDGESVWIEPSRRSPSPRRRPTGGAARGGHSRWAALRTTPEAGHPRCA